MRREGERHVWGVWLSDSMVAQNHERAKVSVILELNYFIMICSKISAFSIDISLKSKD